jgi:hypothetical protein
MPAEIAERLVNQANESLTSDTGSDRFATVLDAIAFSPVHLQVRPVSIPENANEELLTAIRRLSMRVPDIAKLFGIEPTPTPRGGRGRGRGGSRKN